MDTERMRRLAAEYAIDLSGTQLEQLKTYAALLIEWNQRINLTAITEPEEIEQKHFLDSLLLASQPEVEGSLVDVGSGAGFPGMVAKIYKPSLQLTLMEPTGKRVNFLGHLATQLGLAVDIQKERAEEAGRKHWRQSFDVVTARAVAALPVLSEYCLPLAKQGGIFIAMKGDAAGEVQQARYAIERLGGKLKEVREMQLPDGAARSLVLIKKVADTPPAYPRNGGVIAKRPLSGS